MQSPSQARNFVRYAGIPLGIAMAFSLALFFTVFLGTDGASGVETAVLILAGLLGGGLVRAWGRDNLVTVLLFILVIAECALVSRLLPSPWSGLWAVLIPANAIGVMVGSVTRQGLRISKPVPPDVWLINGTEDPRTESARSAALHALGSWDSAQSGRFLVERNQGLFEAMGNPATGFIVHCTPDSRHDSQWRILGSVSGSEEIEIRMPFGPAHVPAGVVADLETTSRALRAFFHYRGPDPELHWSSGEQVLDLKFG